MLYSNQLPKWVSHQTVQQANNAADLFNTAIITVMVVSSRMKPRLIWLPLCTHLIQPNHYSLSQIATEQWQWMRYLIDKAVFNREIHCLLRCRYFVDTMQGNSSSEVPLKTNIWQIPALVGTSGQIICCSGEKDEIFWAGSWRFLGVLQ